MSFYKIPPERVIILLDDISLEPGRLRIRRKGSDGGQNGLKNKMCIRDRENTGLSSNRLPATTSISCVLYKDHASTEYPYSFVAVSYTHLNQPFTEK